MQYSTTNQVSFEKYSVDSIIFPDIYMIVKIQKNDNMIDMASYEKGKKVIIDTLTNCPKQLRID